MHPNIKSLIELQGVDLRVNDLRAALAGLPKRLAEVEARTAAAKERLAGARGALTTSLMDRKRYEMDVEQWRERARKYKDQTYEVKTNEAYKALQHEVQTAEAEMAKAEDRLLERMVAGEEFERQIKAAEQALKEAEAAGQADRKSIEAEQAAAQQELDRHLAERQRVVAAIPEDLLEHYERIARRHNGVALAEVRDETCTMCRVRVRPHVYQELRREGLAEIFHCETCTRILYYVEQPVAQASAGANEN